MARLGTAAKMRRVLDFLIGLRDDRVSTVLAEYGFTANERNQGWDLLRALGLTQAVPTTVPLVNATFVALDAWRQHWMRIAQVCLEADFPRVYGQIFAGIDQPRQLSLAIVPIFADRIDKLERAKDANSCAALAKLRKRGLTNARLDEARKLIEDFRNAKPPQLPDVELQRAQIRKAETALWDFYVEWSQITRATIKEPRLLELLGFRGGASDDEPQGAAAADELGPVATAPLTQAKRRVRGKQAVRKQGRHGRLTTK